MPSAPSRPSRPPCRVPSVILSALASLILCAVATAPLVAHNQRGVTTSLPDVGLAPGALTPTVEGALSLKVPLIQPRVLDGWIPVDSLHVTGTVPAGSAAEFEIRPHGNALGEINDGCTLTPRADSAVAAAPLWLQIDLRDNLRRLGTTDQDRWAHEILVATASTRDEIAFCVAHLSPYTLSRMDGRIVGINADAIYNIAPDLQYVQLVEHGDAATGDWYTTTRYRIAHGSDTTWHEIPRDIYYWWVVMPKLSDEEPAIDASVYNQFWRTHLYTNADAGYPILHDALQGVKVLWDGTTHVWPNQDTAKNPYPFSDTMSAVQAIGQWVHHQLPVMAQPPRPIQPNQILHHHYGNCGELQDLLDGGARTALVPVMPVGSFAGDHTWTELYMDGVWNYWDVWRDGGPTLVHAGYRANEMDFPLKACKSGWRADGLQVPVNDHYSDVWTLRVRVLDAHHNPIDGAEVFLAAATDLHPLRPDSGFTLATWGHTDQNGVFAIQLSPNIFYGFRVDCPFGSAPSTLTQFYGVDTQQARAGATLSYDATVGGVLPQSQLTQAGATQSDREIFVSSGTVNQTVYGAKYWANNGFDLDARDYADVQPGGTVSAFVVDPTNRVRCDSGAPFNAWVVGAGSGGQTSLVNLPWGTSYLVLSGAGRRTSSQVDMNVTLLAQPGTPVQEPDVAPGDSPALLLTDRIAQFPVSVSYQLAAPEPNVDLAVYDLLGRRVATLARGQVGAGTHTVVWESPGVSRNPSCYVVQLRAQGATIVRRVIAY